MKHIGLPLFTFFFLLAYVVVFWILTTLAIVVLPQTLVTASYFPLLFGLVFGFMSWLIVAFGLQSYYKLPARPAKIVVVVLVLQLILNVLSFAFTESYTSNDIGYAVITMVFTALFVHRSLTLAERYFAKKSK